MRCNLPSAVVIIYPIDIKVKCDFIKRTPTCVGDFSAYFDFALKVHKRLAFFIFGRLGVNVHCG